MPGAAIVPLIAAGASLLGGAMSANATGNINDKTINFNREMYARQRADALADFTMQNEYNSPAAQMARLREAGLNPHLVYGKGADNTAQAVRSSSVGSPSLKAPDYNFIGDSLSNYVNTAMRQAQTDNLLVQNTVLEQEAILKAATTASVAQNTARSKFDLEMAEELRQTSMDTARESLRKLKVGTDVTLAENERAAAQNAANLKIAAETILNMRAARANTEAERRNILLQAENLRRSGKLQDLDIELKRVGIQPGDNIFFRVLGRLLGLSERDGLPQLPKDMQLRDSSDKWNKKDSSGLRDAYWKR